MWEKVNIRDILRPILVPIHKEAWVFVFILAAVTVILFLLYAPLGFVGLVVTVWCVYFFRDPPRQTPQDISAIISPADGIVQNIGDASPPSELQSVSGPMRRISIFMNIFNVHINRVPVGGEVIDFSYREGKFFSADMDKASEKNERQSIVLQTASGDKIVMVQIAGLVARRIVCRLGISDSVDSGERFGLIRFGSRVDIYVPHSYSVCCAAGQSVFGGESIIARAPSVSASSGSESSSKVSKTGKVKGVSGDLMVVSEKGYVKGYY